MIETIVISSGGSVDVWGGTTPYQNMCFGTSVAGTSSVYFETDTALTMAPMTHKVKCAYCGNLFVEDKRGRCSSCGGSA